MSGGSVVGSIITEIFAGIDALVGPLVVSNLSQEPPGTTVLAWAVQFNVPTPPFRISIVSDGGAVPPRTYEKVSPVRESNINGSGDCVIVTGITAFCPAASARDASSSA